MNIKLIWLNPAYEGAEDVLEIVAHSKMIFESHVNPHLNLQIGGQGFLELHRINAVDSVTVLEGYVCRANKPEFKLWINLLIDLAENNPNAVWHIE